MSSVFGYLKEIIETETENFPVGYTDDNGNAMFQSYLSQTIQKRNRLKIRSYRRYGEHGNFFFVFLGLFVHAAVRGGICAFTLKIVNTLIKNSSRDDKPSIST